MKKIDNGLLISLEGVDGSGKSTLATSLFQELSKRDLPAILTKEPGGTPLGDLIRPVVLQRNCRIDPKAEYLLFAAGRAQHFDELVLPALKNGSIVISDRMADSSLVYQGYGRGLGLTMLETINTWAMSNRTPDITFYLRLSVDQALERIALRNKNITDFEEKELLQKSINGFEAIFKNKPHVITLDATETPQTLLEQALTAVLTHLEH